MVDEISLEAASSMTAGSAGDGYSVAANVPRRFHATNRAVGLRGPN
jgi:hypothetical protein